MSVAAVPSLRTIRRLNRCVHDPIADWIADWLGAVFVSLARRAWPRFADVHCIPERQDLYGFSMNPNPIPAPEPCEH